MTNMTYAPGPCAGSISAPTDPDATQAFYSALFGWTVQYADPSGYRLCALGDELVAALGPAEDPGLPYWSTNISVHDIVSATQRCAEAGAEVLVPPSSAGPPGDYAVIRDPVGTPVSLWQPGTQTGMQRTGDPGTFAGVTLLTHDADRAARFYEEALGWQLDRAAGVFRLGDQVVARLGNQPPPPTAPRSLWLISFATGERPGECRSRGKAPRRHRGGSRSGYRYRVLRDPAGALLSVSHSEIA